MPETLRGIDVDHLRTDKIEVQIDERTLTLAVRDLRTGLVWRMQETGPGDIGLKSHSGPWTGVAFRDAGQCAWSGDGNRRKALLSHWPLRANVWGPCQHAMEVEFDLAADQLDITIRAVNGSAEASIIDSYYPRGFLFPATTGGDLVLPLGQGCLLRKDFRCDLDHTLPTYAGLGFVMPWWGQLADSGEGLLAVTETPDDVGFRVATEPGGGHTCHPYWQASLGNFRYARRIKYRFYHKIGLVELAKEYRRHAERRGLAVTLKEKAKQRPNVAKLRGATIVNIWHMSNFEKLGIHDKQKHYLPFDDGLRRFQRLARDAGIGKAVVHIDGWGRDGYDSLHPDVLPPNPVCGGWAGLERMATAVKQMGHMFLLHDQYADIYADADAFSPDNTAMDLSGVRPENREWLGGRQQWLCPQRTMPFARRNLTEVENKLKPSGTYLDCFTISHLRECYDQRHPCSRADAREAWSDIFRLCQGWGWATSSEGGADWAVPVLDFCWTVNVGVCPSDLKAKLNGPLGDPIPLYNLVWHDCIVQPEFVEETQKSPDTRLWTMLWGGIPSIRPASLEWGLTEQQAEERAPAEAEFARNLLPIARLHERIGFEEMVNLEILDAERRVMRTSFGDGTQVTVDFNRQTYEIKSDAGPADGPLRFKV
jgi:hypothetical protein